MSRTLYKLHSWMGMIAALGLLIIGLTGSVIVFKEELDGMLYPAAVKPANPSAQPLDMDALLREVQRHTPGMIVRSFGPTATPGRNWQFYVTPVGSSEYEMIYVDPNSGKPTAGTVETSSSVTAWLVELHYTFLADHVGEFIAGIFGLLFCLLGLSGFWLYRHFWKHFFLLRWGRTLRIFCSDTHKMVGISSMLFNLVLGFTGMWWNLSHIAGHIFEDEEAEAAIITTQSHSPNLSLDKLIAQAKAEVPGFQLNWITLADPQQPTIDFYGGMEGQSFLRSAYGNLVNFDAMTGEFKGATTIRTAGWWAQVQDSFRPLHYGNFGGLPIKILWSVLAWAPAILSVTGVIMWWKRPRPKKKRPSP